MKNRKRKPGQSTMEYMILFAAVISFILLFAMPGKRWWVTYNGWTPTIHTYQSPLWVGLIDPVRHITTNLDEGVPGASDLDVYGTKSGLFYLYSGTGQCKCLNAARVIVGTAPSSGNCPAGQTNSCWINPIYGGGRLAERNRRAMQAGDYMSLAACQARAVATDTCAAHDGVPPGTPSVFCEMKDYRCITPECDRFDDISQCTTKYAPSDCAALSQATCPTPPCAIYKPWDKGCWMTPLMNTYPSSMDTCDGEIDEEFKCGPTDNLSCVDFAMDRGSFGQPSGSLWTRSVTCQPF
ncbi:MAG: hypothetical protein Q8Q08_00880 [Candidatus Omnitrophota bacterium]|nr:hypothetical protein [Candidatus Omnitrophota bacterium]